MSVFAQGALSYLSAGLRRGICVLLPRVDPAQLGAHQVGYSTLPEPSRNEQTPMVLPAGLAEMLCCHVAPQAGKV